MMDKNTVILDLDDFHEDNKGMQQLLLLKRDIPGFKVNLFTIPARCSLSFIRAIQERFDWIDMIPHGFRHDSSRECEHWTYRESLDYLMRVESLGLTKGFKAPGWQISDGMYQALLELDWWVADQEYNNHRRPKGLRVYLLDHPNKIHGHVGHMGGYNFNEINLIYHSIEKMTGNEFKFIKDII